MTRRTSTAILGLNSVLIASLVLFNTLVLPPQPKAAPRPLAVIGSLVGKVEVRKRGKTDFAQVAVGLELSSGDEIRTGDFSETTLYLRSASMVTVTAQTNFVVGKEKEMQKRSSFEVGEGRIMADIPRGTGEEYRFLSKGSDAVASVRKGEFSLATDGRGTVVVDTQKGEVKVEAKGRKVSVAKGKRSTILPNKAPSKPKAAPSKPRLEVRWPATRLDTLQAKVAGVTNPGSMLMINGILVRASYNGRFSQEVSLVEGTNRLVVVVTDASGKSLTRESPEIMVDTSPPDIRVNANDLWK